MAQTVTYDNGTSGNASTTTITVSFAVGNNSNRILTCVVYDNATNPVTGITYNGVAMTQVDTGNHGGGTHYQAYILVAPATGTNNLVISQPAGNPVRYVVHSYYQARQTSQPDAHTQNTNYPATGNYSVSLSPTTGTALFFAYGVPDTANITGIPNNQQSNGGILIAGDNGMVSGSNSINGTGGGATSWGLGIMYIAGAPTAFTSTITETSTLTETVSSYIGRVVSILETSTLTETVNSVRGRVLSVLETVTSTDVVSTAFRWVRQAKNSSIWTNETKD